MEVRPESSCAILTLDGPFILDSVVTAYSRIVTHPDWQSNFDMIVAISPHSDFYDTDLAKLQSLRDVARTMNAQHRTGPNLRTALVCSDDLKRVIIDLWLALVDNDWPIEFGVFTSVNEALAWLAKTADTPEA